MKEVDIAIIGGGAAGMAAAVGAYKSGVEDILILERNDSLGGVLHQCIHNGFGVHRFGEDLTGVEFAQRYCDMVEELHIPYMLKTFVIDLGADKIITAVNPEQGLIKIRAKAIVLAMGCRERTRNNLLIPGTRGAGILTAGTAQKYLNIDGYLPGSSVVILGSGDIGLIMARQLALEGVSVKALVEVMPYSSGLARNMKQCIEDFDIPVYYNSTVSRICGRERVSSVWVSRVDENRRPIDGTEFEIKCDTLMISAGLIPENELTEQAGIKMSPVTKGAVVTEDNQTSVSGIFSCGNVLHVHDLVDFVSEEGEATGAFAAEYVLRSASVDTIDESSCGSYGSDLSDAKSRAVSNDDMPVVESEEVSGDVLSVSGSRASQDSGLPAAKRENVLNGGLLSVESGNGVGGIVPQIVRRDTQQEQVSLMFRPKDKFRDVSIAVSSGGRTLCEKKCIALSPGEMCRIDVKREAISRAYGAIKVEIK